MVFSFKKLASLASLITVLSVFSADYAAVASPLQARAQCAATLSTAEVRAHAFFVISLSV